MAIIKNDVTTASAEYLHFRDEITRRIRSAQYEALKAVNKEMIALYWEIGRRITEQQAALGWGKSVVETLSRDIQKEFPGIKGFGSSNMWDMARFYAEYQSNEILQPLVGEISWSKHIVILTKCKDTRQRQFYILATKRYGWTKDVLINKIEAKAYIICKSKSRTIVEYALKSSNMPIGVATYRLSSELPEAYRELLPASEEIIKKIELLIE